MSTDKVDSADISMVEAENRFARNKEVIIVVTRAYGPAGDQIVGSSDVKFDGYPAVPLLIKHEGKECTVAFEPLPWRRPQGMRHGDSLRRSL